MDGLSGHRRPGETPLSAPTVGVSSLEQAVDAGKLTGADKIGERVVKVIGKHKVGKHFIRDITDTSFTYSRDEEKIAAEAAFDGIYVIRTSVSANTLDSAGTVTAYKNLKYVERDFRITKTDDLDLRPIYHYRENRVRAHVLICMLAAYLTWHLREAFAELTYTDQDIPRHTTRSPLPSGQHKQKPKTPANATPTTCLSINTKTSSITSPPSTGRPSSSTDRKSSNSPPPRLSNAGPSNCSAPPCHSPSGSQQPAPRSLPLQRHHPRSDLLTALSRSNKFGLKMWMPLAGRSRVSE